MTFEEVLNAHPREKTALAVASAAPRAVEAALRREHRTAADLAALLSPAAEPCLEEMARRAHRLTRCRFGRTVQMYAPLYLSNECTNACVYCGFSAKNAAVRRTLTAEEARREARLLLDQGFRHILLVAGESRRHVNADTLAALVRSFEGAFPSVSIEVAPLSTEDYIALIAAGVDGLVSYQETYDREAYARFHPAGPKRDFSFRLATADRGGEAGFRRLGIGALLGLSDWRVEAFQVGLHADYLQKRHWRSQVTLSFPRLRPCSGAFTPPHPVPDRALAQMICALRLFLPDCGLVLSTRERAGLRDRLLPLGITQMSAGSRTEPGGYSHAGGAEGQFEVDDVRSPGEVAGTVARLGYEPVWKDWDAAFLEKEQRAPRGRDAGKGSGGGKRPGDSRKGSSRDAQG